LKLLLKSWKHTNQQGTDQIPAELIQAGGNILHSEIHKLINFIWNDEELPQQWKESIIAPIYKRGIKLTTVITEGYHCYQLYTKPHPLHFVSRLVIVIVYFKKIHQVLIRYSVFIR
jgi:hypothetical protein